MYIEDVEDDEGEGHQIRWVLDVSEDGEITEQYGNVMAEKGSSVKRKEIDNAKRAKQKIYDYARSNCWDWFVTLTFPGMVNTDYVKVMNAMRKFLRKLYRRGCQYLFVPELFKSGEGYHWHGLVQGNVGELEDAYNPHTGERITTTSGAPVYNLSDSHTQCDLGWSTVSAIEDQQRVASYLTKYITKHSDAPKGRQRYLRSAGLQVPKVDYATMNYIQVATAGKRFQRDIDGGDFGQFLLAEE